MKNGLIALLISQVSQLCEFSHVLIASIRFLMYCICAILVLLVSIGPNGSLGYHNYEILVHPSLVN